MSAMRYYRELLTDRHRIESFQRALHSVVKPGDRVLDLGAGLGTFSMFAAQAGARDVWAIDGDPVVHVAKTIGILNGYGDQVHYVRGWIPQVSLPGPCDVVIFEDFPPQLIDAGTYRTLQSVHSSYVAAKVRAVPCRATIVVAPVRSFAAWQKVAAFDQDEGERRYEIDWSPSREYVMNAPAVGVLDRDDLAGKPVVLAEFRFDRAPEGQSLGGDVEWHIETPGSVHGLAYWFELDLAPGECLSNAPGSPGSSWSHLFLPVDPPLSLAAGDRLSAAVGWDRLPDGTPSWMSWKVETEDASSEGHEFASLPASLQDLALLTLDAVPELAPETEQLATVLHLTDGKRSIGDIARELRGLHPELNEGEAQRFVVNALAGRARAKELAPQSSARSEQ